jgi:L-iditol 2-dehydrogenase
MIMKAAQLTSLREVKIADIPLPEPKSGEVRVKITNIGICGSDVHYYTQGRIGEQVVKFPFVVGHECSGIVEKVGKGVTRFSGGERVAIEPGVSCGRCQSCLQGKPNTCPRVRFLGTPPIEGAFCEYLCMPAENLFPIPEEMTLPEAAMIEPLSVAIHSINLSNLKLGARVAVFGCGPIGLLVIQVAKARGADQIFASEPILARRQMAQKLGAETFNPQECNPVEYIFDKTRGEGVEVAFEAAGEESTIQEAVLSTKISGEVVIIGIPERDLVSFNLFIARQRELVLKNVRRSNQCVEKAINLTRSGKVALSPLITHKFSLSEIEEGFKLVEKRAQGVIKAMVVNER